MRFAGELLGILAQHLLNSFNPSRQTKALKRAVHILPSRRKAGHERERWGHGSAGHGVALLCGFGTPSLTAQGGQRLHPYFNNGRDIPQMYGPAVRCKKTFPSLRAVAVLHQCIRPLIGAFVLRAIMGISARAISLADRPQWTMWVTSVRMRREDRSSISFLILS